jgi:RNA polymerase sigma factor (sigma-70 family)
VLAVFRRHRALRPEAHDLFQETVSRLLALPHCPDDDAASVRLAVGIARNVAREQLNRHVSRGRYNVGLCSDPDTIPADAEGPFEITARLQQVERVAAQFRLGELSPTDRDILVAVADDVPHREIADELGLKTKTVRNRLCRMRRLAAESWERDWVRQPTRRVADRDAEQADSKPGRESP